MNKLIKPMLKKYEGLPFAQKVQARYVLYFCLVNLGVNLAILLGQILTNSFGEFFLVSLSVGIVSWILFFVFLGGGITVAVPLIILGLIFVFSFQTLAVSAPLAISIFQYLGYTLTVLVLVALLSNRLILFTVVGGFASLFTIVLVVKSIVENNQILKDPNFVTPIVTYYVITGFVIFALVNVKRLGTSAMAFSDKKAKESSARLERLTSAAQLAGENSDIGEKLAQSTSRTQDELKRLEEKIQSLTLSVQSVAQSVNQMETSSKGIAESNEDVRTKIERQKTLVDSSGAAIEQMVASIASVSQISESRRAPLQKLLDTTRLGSEEMKKAMDAMKNIEKSSSGVMDLVKIILGVAAQTNLLAMNAAIEAAHAGDAGAGFAVVASEIRKLSESTRVNTKSITDYLKGNQQQVKDAVAINERAGVSFERIEQEIRTITSAIEEILNSMSELAHAGNEVLISVSELQQGTSLIVDSSNIASKELSKQKDEIPVVMRAVRSAQNDVEVVEEGLKTVMNESAEIESLGSSSRAELEKLKKGLGDLQGGKS